MHDFFPRNPDTLPGGISLVITHLFPAHFLWYSTNCSYHRYQPVVLYNFSVSCPKNRYDVFFFSLLWEWSFFHQLYLLVLLHNLWVRKSRYHHNHVLYMDQDPLLFFLSYQRIVSFYVVTPLFHSPEWGTVFLTVKTVWNISSCFHNLFLQSDYLFPNRKSAPKFMEQLWIFFYFSNLIFIHTYFDPPFLLYSFLTFFYIYIAAWQLCLSISYL